MSASKPFTRSAANDSPPVQHSLRKQAEMGAGGPLVTLRKEYKTVYKLNCIRLCNARIKAQWKPAYYYISLYQACNQGAKHHLQNFSPPREKCVGHCLKNLGPSDKTLCPSSCPKLVTGLVSTRLFPCLFLFHMAREIIQLNMSDIKSRLPTLQKHIWATSENTNLHGCTLNCTMFNNNNACFTTNIVV